jgi:hypothetical protein
MLMRAVHSKDGISTRRLRAAMVTGVVTGVAAASLGGVATANATCIGISGINIGGGCTSTFGNFALVLGNGTADASGGFLNGAIATGNLVHATSDGFGSLAYAGGDGTNATARNGIFNLAAAGLGFSGALGVGTDVDAVADGALANLAVNVGAAKDFTTSTVTAGGGAFNLAANLFGNSGAVESTTKNMKVSAIGNGTSAVNVWGNRNDVQATGVLTNATNLGNVIKTPNGSDSVLRAGGFLSSALNVQNVFSRSCSVAQCGNEVSSQGPLSFAGAIGVINQIVVQSGPGITLRTRLDPNTNNSFSTSNLSSARTQGGAATAGKKLGDKIKDIVHKLTERPSAGAADESSDD